MDRGGTVFQHRDLVGHVIKRDVKLFMATALTTLKNRCRGSMVRESTSESTWFLTGKKKEMKSFDRIVVVRCRAERPSASTSVSFFMYACPAGTPHKEMP